MSGDDTPSLRDLGERLKRAREREQSGGLSGGSAGPKLSGLGLAFRVGVELVAGVAVGAGIGYLTDLWLGTKPWGFLIFFVLGSAASVLNVYRVMSAMKFPPAPAAPNTDDDEDND